MTEKDDRIIVYSDYVCPFCYLGRKSLEEYQEIREQDLEIEWHPFDLRRHKRGPEGEIDHSVEDGKDEAYFEQVRENVIRLKAEYDANEMLDFDALPDQVDSFDAQVASYYVQQEYPDHWAAFDEALFEALWIDGRDIGNTEVISNLAEAVGLDSQEIRAAVQDDDLRTELKEEFAAAQQAGITGVPTFAYGGYAARGAVPPAQLQRLVEGI